MPYLYPMPKLDNFYPVLRRANLSVLNSVLELADFCSVPEVCQSLLSARLGQFFIRCLKRANLCLVPNLAIFCQVP